ncbi:hypothetical protein [Flavobacterium weaverense]|uniref:Uncharacterized protein n=1 Tax=Flavobacterium weaverense TaxID=271156 RepID=A0A3L9ZRW0_9FLAO|nr:hypothetical protein [Flavobacterium weaverense]RMA75030.1 hypothetical protein BC961_2376 [Flavobacterium weaverense]
MDSNIKGNIGEDFVNELAFKSFLKYWCYPSPKFENGNKKEICDLLIIFDNVCIICSVKNYEFKGNYDRYLNKTIEKAVRQIKGAHKILFNSTELKIKHPDRTIEIFPKLSISKIFKIIINLGEGLDFYDITRTTKENDFITIFDKDTFRTIICELDTIPDFIDYLEKRENLFKYKNTKILNSKFANEFAKADYLHLNKNLNQSITIIGSEKDLLSYFFKNTRNFPDTLTKDKYDSALLDISGSWDEFKFSYKTIRKDKADTISYFVDGFVQNEVLNNEYPLKELIAKELLSLNRLQRRAIGNKFFEFYNRIKQNNNRVLHRRFLDHGKLGIVLFNYLDESDIVQLRKLFDIIFETFAYYYKYKHETFILIGINKIPHFTYHIYKNYEEFSKEDEEIIQKNIKELNWFTNYSENTEIVNEFPE